MLTLLSRTHINHLTTSKSDLAIRVFFPEHYAYRPPADSRRSYASRLIKSSQQGKDSHGRRMGCSTRRGSRIEHGQDRSRPTARSSRCSNIDRSIIHQSYHTTVSNIIYRIEQTRLDSLYRRHEEHQKSPRSRSTAKSPVFVSMTLAWSLCSAVG